MGIECGMEKEKKQEKSGISPKRIPVFEFGHLFPE